MPEIHKKKYYYWIPRFGIIDFWIFIFILMNKSKFTCRIDCAFVRAALRFSKALLQKVWRPALIASHWDEVELIKSWVFRFVVSHADDVKLAVLSDRSWSARNAFLFALKIALSTTSFFVNTALSVSLITWIGSVFLIASTFSSTEFAASMLTSI